MSEFLYRDCEICGSKEHRQIWTEDGLIVVRCVKCGFIYTNPMPKQRFEEINPTAWLWLRGGNDKYQIYKEGIDQIKGLNPKGKLLDIGCSYGDFFLLAEKKGYEVTGIDVSKDAVDFMLRRNKKVFYGSLEELNFSDGSFDVVTMWEVLEHLQYPSLVLKEVYRILSKKGILAVDIPNARFQLFKARLLQMRKRLWGKEYLGLMPEVHLNHFTSRSIFKFLEHNNFKVLSILPRNANFQKCYPNWKNIVKRTYSIFGKAIYKRTGCYITPAIMVLARRG